MKTKSLLNRKVQLAFGSAIAILLVVAAFSYRGMILSSESDRLVRHSHGVLENLQELLFAMQSIEASSRGFVLTGEESYLDSYRADIVSKQEQGAAVRDLTLDNPEQQRHLPALEGLAAQKIRFAEEVISLRRAKGCEAATDAIRSGRGERIMNAFQAVVRQLQDEELRCVVVRSSLAGLSRFLAKAPWEPDHVANIWQERFATQVQPRIAADMVPPHSRGKRLFT